MDGFLFLILLTCLAVLQIVTAQKSDVLIVPPRSPTGHQLVAFFFNPDPWIVPDMKLHKCDDRELLVKACGKHCNTSTADALIFSLWRVRIRHLPTTKPLNQPWILYTTESPIQSNRMVPWNRLPPLNSVSWRVFDLFWNYRLDADISEPYLEQNTKAYWLSLFSTADPQFRNQEAPVLWMTSNCNSATNCRMKYVQELMKHLPVHSFGRCLNNQGNVSVRNKTALMQQYKFYLSFENSNCQDYCTEKLMDCYRNGVIPIVMGCKPTPLPHSKAALMVDDFHSPRHLAEYVLAVHRNDSLYREHRVTTALLPDFMKHFVVEKPRSVWCKVIDAVVNFQRDISHRPLSGRHISPDFTCNASDPLYCYGA